MQRRQLLRIAIAWNLPHATKMSSDQLDRAIATYSAISRASITTR
ncbi:MAG: hypothetical protein VKK04_25690 [Synechococcales bacterium]|nr:hypothetical protein [Synechococcales bacterium]